MSIIDALLGTQAGGQNALGFPMPAPGTGAQFNLPVTQQQMGVQPQQGPSKFRNFLGALGDALMVGHGGQPLYHQRMQQQQTQGALQGFLQDPDAAIAALMQVDAPKAVELYTQLHAKQNEPELIQELRAAGIDPQSDQGKQILVQHLSGQGQSDTTFVRTLEALGIDPHSQEAKRLYYGSVSPAGYLLRPPAEGGGAVGPKAGDVEEGYRFKGGDPSKQENWEPASGGPTASPSATFR